MEYKEVLIQECPIASSCRLPEASKLTSVIGESWLLDAAVSACSLPWMPT